MWQLAEVEQVADDWEDEWRRQKVWQCRSYCFPTNIQEQEEWDQQKAKGDQVLEIGIHGQLCNAGKSHISPWPFSQTQRGQSTGSPKVGFTFHLLKDAPRLISKNIENSLVEAFTPLGITDWNSLFWIAHPGGPAILDQVEEKLALKEEKLRATREVLKEYGNMSSACVLFILDEMRRKSAEEGKGTTGEGLEWGVLFRFGPGLTVETVVLHSLPIQAM